MTNSIEIQEIHMRAVEVAGKYKRAESDLLDILQQADAQRVYLHFGQKSLFDYVVRSLGLSEGTAYNMITVARKAVEVPSLKAAIKSGQLTVAKARKMTPVLNLSNQQEWITKAASLSTRKLELEVARAIEPEKEFYKSVTLRLSAEVFEKLERVREMECQRLKKVTTLENSLAAIVDKYLEQYDPVRKAERIIKKVETKSLKLVTGQVTKKLTPTTRAPTSQVSQSQTSVRQRKIPALTLHAVRVRDQGRCTYRDKNGQRCSEGKWVETHHVSPKSLGGADSLSNLTTLCAGHHRLVHFQMLLG
jgi:hypothetical protein